MRGETTPLELRATPMSAGPMKAARVRISLSDPWDLGESIGWRILHGSVVMTSREGRGGRVLVRLDLPILFRGESYQFAVGAPRHEDAHMGALQGGDEVFCSFVGVSEEQARSESPLSTEHWRGGLSFIGTIALTR